MKKQYIIFILSFIIITFPLLLLARFVPGDDAIKQDGFGALASMLNNALQWFINIATTIAAITFAIGGAKILFNPGNSSAISEGKAVLWKTVQGMVIILTAWLVVNVIVSTLVKEESINALRFLK